MFGSQACCTDASCDQWAAQLRIRRESCSHRRSIHSTDSDRACLGFLCGTDPYLFRKNNIRNPRWVGVLDAVAKAARWTPRTAASALGEGKVVGAAVLVLAHMSLLTAGPLLNSKSTVRRVWLRSSICMGQLIAV